MHGPIGPCPSSWAVISLPTHPLALAQLQEQTEAGSSRGPRAEDKHRRPGLAYHEAAAPFAGLASAARSLELLAGDAELFAAQELPALRQLLGERIRAQEMQAGGAAGKLTEEADALFRAVERETDEISGTIAAPLQRAEAQREAAARTSEEAVARLRAAVNTTVKGLLDEISEMEELRKRDGKV